MIGNHGEVETEDLEVPTKYKDMIDELIEFSKSMTDTIQNIDRAIDHFRKEGHYVNKANMEEVFDTVGYVINDFYSYPKQRQYDTYSEIFNVDFQKLSDGMPVDTINKLD
jgi:hypothetical protein